MTNGNNFLAYQVWIGLPKDIRVQLAQLFDLKPTGDSVVHVGAIIDGNISGEAKSDGFTPQDLQELTVEKLQNYLESTSVDFYKLFNEVLDSIGMVIEKMPDVVIADEVPKKIAPFIKKVKKVKKNGNTKQKK